MVRLLLLVTKINCSIPAATRITSYNVCYTKLLRTTAHNPLQPKFTSRAGHKQHWSRLHGSSLALTLSRLATEQKQVLIVLTPDTLSAQHLVEEIRFYSYNFV